MIPLTIKVKPELLAALDRAYRITGEGRAQFLRTALRDRLASLGVDLPDGSHLANDRKGVGGSPTHRSKAKGS